MTEATVTVEQAGDALYTAHRAAQDAATLLRADTGSDDFRSVFIDAFRTVTIHVASADAPLSSDEAIAINQIFWLDRTDSGLVDAAVLAHPDRVTTAVGFLTDMARLIDRADKLLGKPSTRRTNQLIVSADCIFQTVLAAGNVEELNRARTVKIMAEFCDGLPDDQAAPMAPPALPVADPTLRTVDQGVPTPSLQPVACPARLHVGETCYATTSAVLFQESNVVRTVRYGGLSGRVGIIRGVSYRTGSYNVDRTRAPKIERIADGTLCITDQRLIFLSDTKNLDLPFAKLLSCSTEPGTIEVTRPNSGRTLFEFLDTSAIEVFEQVTGTSADHRHAVEAEPVQNQRATPFHRIGRALGTGLFVLLGLLLLLIYVVL